MSHRSQSPVLGVRSSSLVRVALAALLVSGAGCSEDDVAADGSSVLAAPDLAQPFTRLDEDRARIVLPRDPTLMAAAASMDTMCRTASLVLENGFSYFAIDPTSMPHANTGPIVFEVTVLRELAPGQLAFESVQTAPQSAIDSPEALEALFRAPMDARAVLEICGRVEYDPAREPVVSKYAEPGVLVGDAQLLRTILLRDSTRGDARSVTFVRRPQPSLWVTFRQSALRVSLAGEVLEEVAFERRVGDVRPLDVDGDGLCEFVNRGGGWQSVSLAAHDGRTLWEFPSPAADGRSTGDTPDMMASGDLDGDGRPEFVVGLNADGGLVVLDADGREQVRHAATNVFCVALLDLDGDGRDEIVHSGDGCVAVRDGRGATLRDVRGGSSFGVVRWPPGDGEVCLAVRRDGGVQLVSAASGEDVATFADAHDADDGLASLDLGGSFGRVLAEGQTLSATGRRAVLRLLHPERGLLYEEALAVPYLGLAVIPADMTGGPALVVAGGDTVSVYEAR